MRTSIRYHYQIVIRSKRWSFFFAISFLCMAFISWLILSRELYLLGICTLITMLSAINSDYDLGRSHIDVCCMIPIDKNISKKINSIIISSAISFPNVASYVCVGAISVAQPRLLLATIAIILIYNELTVVIKTIANRYHSTNRILGAMGGLLGYFTVYLYFHTDITKIADNLIIDSYAVVSVAFAAVAILTHVVVHSSIRWLMLSKPFVSSDSM